MPWPDHTPQGELSSARQLLDEIVLVCQQRLSGTLPPLLRPYYEQILAHAESCRENQAHGNHRAYVEPDGTGTPPDPQASLDAAWAQVRKAHELVSLAQPTLAQLQQALVEVDHGGG